jgi:hypothetical protein
MDIQEIDKKEVRNKKVNDNDNYHTLLMLENYMMILKKGYNLNTTTLKMVILRKIKIFFKYYHNIKCKKKVLIEKILSNIAFKNNSLDIMNDRNVGLSRLDKDKKEIKPLLRCNLIYTF